MHSTGKPDTAARDLAVVCYLFFTFGWSIGFIIVYLNPYLREIGLTGVQIGIISSLSPLALLAANTLWGYISDRTGQARLLLAIAPVVSAAAALALEQTRSFPLILLLSVVFNAFCFPINTLLATIAIQQLGGRSEGFGQIRVWTSIGFIAGALGFGFFAERIGLRWLFTGYAAASVLFLIGVLVMRPARVTTSQQPLLMALRTLARSRAWVLFMLSVFVFSVGSIGANTFLTVYMRDNGANPNTLGVMSTVAAIAEMPTFIMGALLLRRYGSRRLLLIGYAAYVVRWALYGLMPAPGWAIPISLLQSVSFGFYLIAAVSYANSLAPDDLKGTTQGLFFGAGALAGFVGSPLIGWLYDALGGRWMFLICAAIGLGALAILYFTSRPEPDETLART
ncbi:MAG: MFS transporter [Anaerolineae bacterium]|nr:MFS transporter [Anaerolineae bacterium]